MMPKRIYLMLGVSLLVCLLLLAAVLIPTGSSASPSFQLIVKEPSNPPVGMVWVAGGQFKMGNETPPPAGNPERIKADEYPAHDVELDGFWMDPTPVTNAEFKTFVDATNYVTFAERQLTKKDFEERGVDTRNFPTNEINAGSMCFNPDFNRKQLVQGVPGWEHQVWQVIDGANWKYPDGPGSTIDDRMDHPVVHIAYEDAVAYCEWAGKRLPTEAEFEYASRNRGEDLRYPWGNDFLIDGKYQANFWQGEFPHERKTEDGFLTTSPVKSFPANGLGLYDLAGNVWEWCSDLYAEDYYSYSPKRNPKGPLESRDALNPGMIVHVQRGGSFMCNVNNCTGYRTRARSRADIAGSSFHNGFRCVVDPSMLKEYHQAQKKIR